MIKFYCINFPLPNLIQLGNTAQSNNLLFFDTIGKYEKNRIKLLGALSNKDKNSLETALADFDKVIKTDKQKEDQGELLKMAEKRLGALKTKDGRIYFSHLLHRFILDW